MYRYHLHDIVEAVDRFGRVPCLRFLGRGDKVSDWFGEKLHEQFVVCVLEELFGEYGLSPLFALLAPDDSQEDFRYILYLELSSDQRPKEGLAGLASDLDRKLRRNFHYDYCRKLGQLASVDIYWIAHGALEAYLDACRALGQRMGDIKPSPLQKTTGWGDRFSRLDDQDAPS